MVSIDVYAACANPGNNNQAVIAEEVAMKCDLEFPNAFSPNGDGVNEMFTPKIIESCYTENLAQVKIFDAVGRLVCENRNYLDTNLWDGKSDMTGNIVLSGTYFYVIEIEIPDAKNEIFKGFIEVR